MAHVKRNLTRMVVSSMSRYMRGVASHGKEGQSVVLTKVLTLPTHSPKNTAVCSKMRITDG